MGLFSFAFAGGSLILIGAWESFSSSLSLSASPSPSPPTSVLPKTPKATHHAHKTLRFSTVTLLSTAFLSLLFIFDAFVSFTDAVGSKDKVGYALQLQIIAVSALFFLFSFLGLLSNFSKSISFPFLLVDLILLFGFVEEFLLYYLHLKDPNGVENRYYSLMLVPILVCIVSTMIELKKPESNMLRLARGLGLILQGLWLIQMGLSFFTSLMAHNCGLHRRSRGNYTIKCKGHMETHRGGAIAVLLFNCYLALLVAVISGVYSLCRNHLNVDDYKPLGEMAQEGLDYTGNFTLDSDSEDAGTQEINNHQPNLDGSISSGDNAAIELSMSINGHLGVHH